MDFTTPTFRKEPKKYDPVIFPENPNDFNPVGMTKHSYNQGRIIKWGYTDKIAIFEWNEDEKIWKPLPLYAARME